MWHFLKSSRDSWILPFILKMSAFRYNAYSDLPLESSSIASMCFKQTSKSCRRNKMCTSQFILSFPLIGYAVNIGFLTTMLVGTSMAIVSSSTSSIIYFAISCCVCFCELSVFVLWFYLFYLQSFRVISKFSRPNCNLSIISPRYTFNIYITFIFI